MKLAKPSAHLDSTHYTATLTIMSESIILFTPFQRVGQTKIEGCQWLRFAIILENPEKSHFSLFLLNLTKI